MTMRITFSMEGGLVHLPGRARPATIDVDALPPEERDRLCALVESAGFFSGDEPPRREGLPDARTYTVAIDDGARCRTRRLADPVGDPRMAALLHAVRDLVTRR